jgi:hypothetical protein
MPAPPVPQGLRLHRNTEIVVKGGPRVMLEGIGKDWVLTSPRRTSRGPSLLVMGPLDLLEACVLQDVGWTAQLRG